MKLQPIIRNFYTEPRIENSNRKSYVTVYELKLYNDISLGSFPKFILKGIDKTVLINIAKDLTEEFNLLSFKVWSKLMVPEESSGSFVLPIVIDNETGEIINS